MFPANTKILVVDDMLTMRKVVRKCLADIGLKENITEADDGATAWPKILDAIKIGQPFQLIVSDWNMPVTKGIDLLRMVRQTEGIAKTPFLLLTAESELSQVKEALEAGVSGYVLKPFTVVSLKEKLLAVYAKHFGNSKAA